MCETMYRELAPRQNTEPTQTELALYQLMERMYVRPQERQESTLERSLMTTRRERRTQWIAA